jgi:ferrochelatase
VLCPGFAVDSLETLEEIPGEVQEAYHHAGGGEFHYIPALNDHPDHVALLCYLVEQHLQGWV